MHAYGSATIGIQLDNNGGIANGGVDVSPVVNMIITVTHVDHAPAGDTATYAVPVSGSVAIVLLATDIDNAPLTYAVATKPRHGTLTGTAPNLTYTPVVGYVALTTSRSPPATVS